MELPALTAQHKGSVGDQQLPHPKPLLEAFYLTEDPGWEVTLTEFSSQFYQPLMALGQALSLFASPRPVCTTKRMLFLSVHGHQLQH